MNSPSPMRIATVPGTPLLIPEVAAGAAGEFDDVRAAAIARVAWAAGTTGGVTVLTQDPSAMSVNPIELPAEVSLGSLGVPRQVPTQAGRLTDRSEAEDVLGETSRSLPVAVLVAAWLAHAAQVRVDAVWSVPVDPARVSDDDISAIGAGQGVVLIADGSCTRTAKAPGSLVEGSVEFDDVIVAALVATDGDYFRDPDRSADAANFQAQGLGVWALASHLLGLSAVGDWIGEVDLTADPLGVMYVVGGWHLIT